MRFASNVGEARGVAKIVAELIHREGVAPSDIVVLAHGDHNATFSGPIKHALQGRGIPVDDPARSRPLLNASENRTMMLASHAH